MRKITREAAQAMKSGINYSNSNTVVHSDGGVMDLHGNTIAIFDGDSKLTLRDSGWRSNTTKERLNGLLYTFSSEWRIYQLKGKWYITDGMGKQEDWKGFKVFDV